MTPDKKKKGARTFPINVTDDWRESNLMAEGYPPILDEQGLSPWLDEVEEYVEKILHKPYPLNQKKILNSIKKNDETGLLEATFPVDITAPAFLIALVKATRNSIHDPESVAKYVSRITRVLISPYIQANVLARNRPDKNSPDKSERDKNIRTLRNRGWKFKNLAKEFELSDRQIKRICKEED